MPQKRPLREIHLFGDGTLSCFDDIGMPVLEFKGRAKTHIARIEQIKDERTMFHLAGQIGTIDWDGFKREVEKFNEPETLENRGDQTISAAQDPC